MEPRRIQPITISTTIEKKTETPKPSIRFVLELTESNLDVCPEFSYPDLIKNALEEDEADSDPFDNTDDSKMAAMAEKFERKYGNMKNTRLKGQGCNINDLGDGYDDTDEFIDNSEAYAETVADTMTTEFGGFYINFGNLELKAMNGRSSDDDDDDEIDDEDMPSSMSSSSSSSSVASSMAERSDASRLSFNSRMHRNPLKRKLLKHNRQRIISDDDSSKPSFKKSPFTVTKFKKKFKSFGPNLDVAKAIRRRKIIKAKKLELAKLKSVQPKVIVEKMSDKPAIRKISSSSNGASLDEPLAKRPSSTPVTTTMTSSAVTSAAPPTTTTSPTPTIVPVAPTAAPAVPEYISAQYESVIDAVINMGREPSTMEPEELCEDDRIAIGDDLESADSDNEMLGMPHTDSTLTATPTSTMDGDDSVFNAPKQTYQHTTTSTPQKSSPPHAKPPMSPQKSPVKSPLKSPSSSSITAGAAGGGSPNPLPSYISDTLRDNIEKLKQEAVVTVTDKRKFFNSRVNRLLLQIDKESRISLHGTIGLVYSHLADHLPCSKLTLLNRSKKLRIIALNNTLEFPMQIFTDAVKEAMVPQISAYNDICKIQLKNCIDPHSITFPKPEFRWSDKTRECFRTVVRAKLNMYEHSRESKEQNRTEYLMYFFLDILSIWPQDWMNARTLYYESSIEHAQPNTNTNNGGDPAKKTKKSISAAAKVSELVKQVTEEIYVGSPMMKKHCSEVHVTAQHLQQLPSSVVVSKEVQSSIDSSKDLMPPPNTTHHIKKQISPNNKDAAVVAAMKQRASLSLNYSQHSTTKRLFPVVTSPPKSPVVAAYRESPPAPKTTPSIPPPHQHTTITTTATGGVSPSANSLPCPINRPTNLSRVLPTSKVDESHTSKPSSVDASPSYRLSQSHVTPSSPSIDSLSATGGPTIYSSSSSPSQPPSKLPPPTPTTTITDSLVAEQKYDSVMKSNMSDIVLDFLTAQSSSKTLYPPPMKQDSLVAPPSPIAALSPVTPIIPTVNNDLPSHKSFSRQSLPPTAAPKTLPTPPPRLGYNTPPGIDATKHLNGQPLYPGAQRFAGLPSSSISSPSTPDDFSSSRSPLNYQLSSPAAASSSLSSSAATSGYHQVTPQYYSADAKAHQAVLAHSHGVNSLLTSPMERIERSSSIADDLHRQQQQQQAQQYMTYKSSQHQLSSISSSASSESFSPLQYTKPYSGYSPTAPPTIAAPPAQFPSDSQYRLPSLADKKPALTFDLASHCLPDVKPYPHMHKGDSGLPSLEQPPKVYPFITQNAIPKSLLSTTSAVANQYSTGNTVAPPMFQTPNYSALAATNQLINQPSWPSGNGPLYSSEHLTALQLNQQMNAAAAAAAAAANFTDFYANMQANSVPSNTSANKNTPR